MNQITAQIYAIEKNYTDLYVTCCFLFVTSNFNIRIWKHFTPH